MKPLGVVLRDCFLSLGCLAVLAPTVTVVRAGSGANTTTPAPPVAECVTYDGTVITATEEAPYVTYDDFSCTSCFCPTDYDYVDDDGANQALCLVGDCATPRCVNPVRKEGDCCPLCPDGENCYLRPPRKRRVRIIPAGKEVKRKRKICHCDPTLLYFGQPYRTVAICTRR